MHVQNRGISATVLYMSTVLIRLLEIAANQHGLFTVAQAATVQVGDEQVRRMAASGVLERRAQGVYQIAGVPFNQYTELMEAVLWAKGRGLIAGESALLLWDLADVNPRKFISRCRLAIGHAAQEAISTRCTTSGLQ